MKALVFKAPHQPIELEELPAPQEGENEVLVRIHAAALNHRDVWMTKGLYPGLKEGVIPGSDGAGISEGKAVILNPNVNWGTDPGYFGRNYTILGMPTNGTFAEYLSIQRDRLVEKPAHLSYEAAAALPLAGLTAYRVLFSKCRLRAGEKVLISGVGGGVALFACQFALAIGAEVYVTSGADWKIEKAIEMGAKGGANYRHDDWHKILHKASGGFQVIIDSAAGDGFGQLLSMCQPGARIGLYGGTRGNINKVSPHLIFWRQLEIYGSTMGNDQEFQEMVHFVSEHKIEPVIDSVFSLEEAALAYEKMNSGAQFGKIILKID
ncbi:MAG TPA: zinc-binding dehydrogenase [Saprospiraceae bacterium]|nr:zinc-binding dehydrogenase [Saprospiraceae bacterium]HMQ83465.1 zinc-binding dehydrogenase [Saprospiraceae bacterium]